jgi:hypothetical protein
MHFQVHTVFCKVRILQQFIKAASTPFIPQEGLHLSDNRSADDPAHHPEHQDVDGARGQRRGRRKDVQVVTRC